MRTESTADRRYQDLRLTPAAVTLVPKLATLADGNDAEMFRVLSASERKVLLTLLRNTVERHHLTQVPVE